jgi:uncharacterized coiled-coil protein SlyX
MTARLDNVDKRVDSLEEINSSQTKINQDIQVRLAEIQKDVLYIRKELDKHAAE